VKSVGAILLLVLFFSPFILKIGVMTNWILQHDYIVEYLCVQKDEAVNTCNGRCHLNKNLEKIDKSSQQKKDDIIINFSKLEYNPFIVNDYIEFETISEILNCIPNTFFKDGVSQYIPHLDIPPPKFC